MAGKESKRWGTNPTNLSTETSGFVSSESMNPEERTRQLFNLSLSELADHLIPENGEPMIIAVPGTDRKIQLSDIEEFPEVGTRWRKIKEMPRGVLWNPLFTMGRNRVVQNLIAAGERGSLSCIRIREAKYFDPKTSEFVSSVTLGERAFRPRENDIAGYLGLSVDQQSRLRFVDNSNTLYLGPQSSSQ